MLRALRHEIDTAPACSCKQLNAAHLRDRNSPESAVARGKVFLPMMYTPQRTHQARQRTATSLNVPACNWSSITRRDSN